MKVEGRRGAALAAEGLIAAEVELLATETSEEGQDDSVHMELEDNAGDGNSNREAINLDEGSGDEASASNMELQETSTVKSEVQEPEKADGAMTAVKPGPGKKFRRRTWTVLVVCPINVIENWSREFSKWVGHDTYPIYLLKAPRL